MTLRKNKGTRGKSWDKQNVVGTATAWCEKRKPRHISFPITISRSVPSVLSVPEFYHPVIKCRVPVCDCFPSHWIKYVSRMNSSRLLGDGIALLRVREMCISCVARFVDECLPCPGCFAIIIGTLSFQTTPDIYCRFTAAPESGVRFSYK